MAAMKWIILHVLTILYFLGLISLIGFYSSTWGSIPLIALLGEWVFQNRFPFLFLRHLLDLSRIIVSYIVCDRIH